MYVILDYSSVEVKLSLDSLPKCQFLTIIVPYISSARPLSPLLSALSHGTLFEIHQIHLV